VNQPVVGAGLERQLSGRYCGVALENEQAFRCIEECLLDISA
jgi:hypothetical protein